MAAYIGGIARRVHRLYVIASGDELRPATLEFYEYTAGKFLEWIKQRGATSPEEVTAR